MSSLEEIRAADARLQACAQAYALALVARQQASVGAAASAAQTAVFDTHAHLWAAAGEVARLLG